MVIGKTKIIENMVIPKVIRYKFTPENIDKFYVIDNRIGTLEYEKDMKGVKGAILEMKTFPKTKEYPERYDLTVFTYDQNVNEPFYIIDGSHRLTALKEIFKEKTLNYFEIILIPSNILYYNMTPTEMLKANKDLDKELRRKGIPVWVKKYDYDEEALEGIGRRIKIYNKRNIWVNVNLINSGGKDKTRLTIEEYEVTRQKQ